MRNIASILLTWAKYYICLHFPSSGNLQSTLHCIALTQNKRLRKEIKYILIHNNTFQSFVWSTIALKIHVSHFENWLFLFVVSLQKWLLHFLLQKRWKNEGFQGICHSINGGSLEITHVFYLSIITSVSYTHLTLPTILRV